MHALLKEQGIWEPLFRQMMEIDKFILEQQEEKLHSLILLLLSIEVLYEVYEEFLCYGSTWRNSS